MTMLTLPFYGPLVEKLPFVGDRGFAGQTTMYVVGGTTTSARRRAAGDAGHARRAVRRRRRRRAWRGSGTCGSSAGRCSTASSITMFSGFFTDRAASGPGIWGTLDYWWRPEARTSADGPAYYYAMILPGVRDPADRDRGRSARARCSLRGGWRNRIVVAVAAGHAGGDHGRAVIGHAGRAAPHDVGDARRVGRRAGAAHGPDDEVPGVLDGGVVHGLLARSAARSRGSPCTSRCRSRCSPRSS